jgi:hypothetical protein
MKRWAWLFLIVVIISGRAVLAQDEVGDLLGRINALRASVGLAPYALNGALSGAAQDQAQWIVSTGSVAHTRPDGNGVRSRALAFGYPTTDVSENIYGGSGARVGDAWSFWVNSGIHYRGLVNDRYQHIGIGIARGSWGAAFVLVFGNPGGPAPAPPAASGGGGSANAAPARQQPSYVRGNDEVGNILHEVQQGDTLGDILLIYGYTWAELPYLMEINGLTDVRDLEVGSLIRVPPKAGTYTPTPGEPTAAPTETPQYPTPYPEDPMLITPSPTATAAAIATAAAVPESLLLSLPTPSATASATPTALAVAMIPTPGSATLPTTADTQSLPVWLIIGLGLQVFVLLGAGIDFFRRRKHR